MNQRSMGIILLIIGLVLAVLSLAADLVGLGEGSAFGYKQITGLVVGIVGVIAGALLLRRRPE